MIPEELRNTIKQVKKLRVKNSVDDNYRFDCKTNTLFIPVYEKNFAKQFKDFRNLEGIELNIYNEIKDAHAMFYQCINLKKVKFAAKLNLEYTYDLSYLFYNCSSLIEIDLSNIITGDSPLYLDNMFCNCRGLREVNFGDNFRNKNVYSASYLFYGCKRLKQLDLRVMDFTNTERSYYMFDCTNPDLEVLVNGTFKKFFRMNAAYI